MKRLALIALILSLASLTHAQGGSIGSNASTLINNTGRPVAGASVAVCQPLATTAASLTSTIATFTMASNPVTAGFVSGMVVEIAGFTGADTYFNNGSIVGSVITNGVPIISVTSTKVIVGPIVHADGTASSNGTLLQMGNSTTSCAGLAAVYTDPTDATLATNPFTTDGFGNWQVYGPPATYYVQFYGASIFTTLKIIVPGGGTSSACITTGGISYENGTPNTLTCGATLTQGGIEAANLFEGNPTSSFDAFMQAYFTNGGGGSLAFNIFNGLETTLSTSNPSVTLGIRHQNLIDNNPRGLQVITEGVGPTSTNGNAVAVYGETYVNIPSPQTISGFGNLSTGVGGYGEFSGTGTLSGFLDQPALTGVVGEANNDSTGTIANIAAITASVGGNNFGGTVHNSYGVYALDQSGIGDTFNADFYATTQITLTGSNYAFYNATGKSHFNVVEVTGTLTASSPVINGTPTGTGIPTLTLKSGSGGGNYTGTNTTYVLPDASNLCSAITIPSGWKLLVSASGDFSQTTSIAGVQIALTDTGTTCIGGGITPLAGSERVYDCAPAGSFCQFQTQALFTGDGAAHSISLMIKTGNIADAWNIGNSSSTRAPSMSYTLMPSN